MSGSTNKELLGDGKENSMTLENGASQRRVPPSPTLSGAPSSATMTVQDTGISGEETKLLTEKQDWTQLELDAMFEKLSEQKFDGVQAFEMPEGFRDTVQLYDYQEDGIRWLKHQETNETRVGPFWKEIELGIARNKWWQCSLTNKRQDTRPVTASCSMLADEMGLGKTIQTIGLILSNMPEADATAHCNLIVAPLSVIAAWKLQISQFVKPNYLNVAVYQGANREAELKKVLRGKTNVLLTSYETLTSDYKLYTAMMEEEEEEKEEAAKLKSKKKAKRCEVQDAWKNSSNGSDSEEFELSDESEDEVDHILPASMKRKQRACTPKTWIFDISFHRIVLDEAHTIRNGETSRFQSSMAITAENKLAITGTPYVNKPYDLLSLFSFLGADPLSDKRIFDEKIYLPIRECREIGLSRIRTMMSHLALRRTKAIVNSTIQLVPKEVVIRTIEWPESFHKSTHDVLYKTARAAFVSILKKGGQRVFGNTYRFFALVTRVRQSCDHGGLVPEEAISLAKEVSRELDESWVDADGAFDIDGTEGKALLEKLLAALKGPEDCVNDFDNECAVCMEELEDENVAVLRTCKHVICGDCLSKIETHHCPLCRKSYGPNDIVQKSAAEAAAKKPTKKKKSQPRGSDEGAAEMSPKEAAVLDEIRSMGSDEKAVIFSQWTSMLDILASLLVRHGYICTRIDGTMSTNERVEAMEALSSDDDGSPRIMLCSLKATGTGVSLIRANVCIICDAWWNAATENQAMDRIHRIGQTRPVRVVRLIMKDSLEERLVHVQESKTALGKGSLQKLSKNEREKAKITAMKDLFEVNDKVQKWKGHFADEDNGEGDDLGGFIVDDDVCD